VQQRLALVRPQDCKGTRKRIERSKRVEDANAQVRQELWRVRSNEKGEKVKAKRGGKDLGKGKQSRNTKAG